jgi:CubicO group peptidase (beta-lactamase class C family)
MVFFNLGLGCLFIMLFIPGRILADRSDFISSGNKKLVKWLWAFTVAIILISIAAGSKNIPVPKWSQIDPMAEASLRTTVHDMASFLLELADPAYLSEDLANQLKDSQITLHSDISWGLGMGIVHSSQGDALWQWGQNIDFQSFTMIYPEDGFGAVVFTNSDWNQPDVAIEIANRALGGDMQSLKRAAHLEFNMQLEEDQN